MQDNSSKLEYIDTYCQLIEDKYDHQLLNDIKDDLSTISDIINNINDKISKYDLCKNKCIEAKKQLSENHILQKKIFEYYVLLTSQPKTTS